MATQDSGKSIDWTTDWTDWTADLRGFWFRERRGPTGVQEYEYDYHVAGSAGGQQQDSQSRRPSTPRTAWDDKGPQSLDSYGSPPLEAAAHSPNFIATAPANTQISTTQYAVRPKINFAQDITYSNPLSSSNTQDWRGISDQRFETASKASTFSQPSAGRSEYEHEEANTLAIPKRNAGSPPKDYPGSSQAPGYMGSSYNENRAAGTLDLRYKVIPNNRLDKFWTIGRVYLTLWAEPARQDQQIPRPRPKNGGAPSNASHFDAAQYGTPAGYLGGVAHWEIRRFVVVGKNYGNALCSPIHTYGGQACLKVGLPDVHKHAIIYTSDTPPHENWYEAEDGTIVEESLTMSPIRVVREQRGTEGDLGHLSRINFSKVYTVEFYVPVLNVGMVHPHMLETLTHYATKARDEPSQGPVRRHHSNSGKQDQHASKSGSSKDKDKSGKQEQHVSKGGSSKDKSGKYDQHVSKGGSSKDKDKSREKKEDKSKEKDKHRKNTK